MITGEVETYQMENDITVYCETAKSFPDGIMEAHEKLHAHISKDKRRRFFGISYGQKNGAIIYKAAAQELEQGELKKFGLEEFIIRKGTYINVTIPDFVNNIPAISASFKTLLADLRIDFESACVEMWYSDEKDLRCMVRLADAKI